MEKKIEKKTETVEKFDAVEWLQKRSNTYAMFQGKVSAATFLLDKDIASKEEVVRILNNALTTLETELRK